MKKISIFLTIMMGVNGDAQLIGINTTNPRSIFEIAAANPLTPNNMEGLRVPRVNAFTTSTLNTESFGLWDYHTGMSQNYYWDFPNSRFESFRNTLDQAYDSNGFGLGRFIEADNGAVKIEGDGLQVTGAFSNGLSMANTTINTGLVFYPKKAILAFLTKPATISDSNLGTYSFEGRDPDSRNDYSSMFGSSFADDADYCSVFGNFSTRGIGAVGMGNGFTAGFQTNSVVLGQNGLSFTHGQNTVLGNNGAFNSIRNILIGNGNSVVNLGPSFFDASGFVVGNYNGIGDSFNFGTILGFHNVVQSGGSAFVLGTYNTVFRGYIIGNHINSYTYKQKTFGCYNTTYSPDPDQFNLLVPNNRLFVIGNGTPGNLSDAMVILEDGRTSYGNSFPKTNTDIEGGFAMNPGISNVINSAGQLLTIGDQSYLKVDATDTPTNRSITLEDGLVAGQLLIVECIAIGGNGIQIPNSLTNVAIGSASIQLTEDDTITLLWNGLKWIKLGNAAN